MSTAKGLKTTIKLKIQLFILIKQHYLEAEVSDSRLPI